MVAREGGNLKGQKASASSRPEPVSLPQPADTGLDCPID